MVVVVVMKERARKRVVEWKGTRFRIPDVGGPRFPLFYLYFPSLHKYLGK